MARLQIVANLRSRSSGPSGSVSGAPDDWAGMLTPCVPLLRSPRRRMGPRAPVPGGFGAPVRHRYESGLDHRVPLEEPGDLVARPHDQGAADVPVDIDRAARLLRGERNPLVRGVGDDDEAAGGEGFAQFGDGGVRVVGVLDEVEYGDEQQGHRAVQVEQSGDLRALHDALRVTEIRGGDHRPLVSFEYDPAVRDRDGVVIDIRDAGFRVGRLGDFVHIAESRYSGADVQELVDALAHRVTHSPAHKGPIRLHDLGEPRHELHGLASRFPVHLEIVRSAQIEVVHARHARHRDVNALRCPGGTLHRCLQQVATAIRPCSWSVLTRGY